MCMVAQPNPTFRSLPDAHRRLVRLMQSTHFGRIERLTVRNGQPVFDPPPRVVRTVKIAGRNQSRVQADSSDFTLRSEWLEFLGHLVALHDGIVLSVEIAHGLPLFFEVEEIVQG